MTSFEYDIKKWMNPKKKPYLEFITTDNIIYRIHHNKTIEQIGWFIPKEVSE